MMCPKCIKNITIVSITKIRRLGLSNIISRVFLICPRWCRHEIEAQRAIQRICTAAMNEAVFLAYRVAIPRHRFSWRKAFSTRCRSLYSSLSNSLHFLRFDLRGMTGFMS